jgi:hypothetical protein
MLSFFFEEYFGDTLLSKWHTHAWMQDIKDPKENRMKVYKLLVFICFFQDNIQEDVIAQ